MAKPVVATPLYEQLRAQLVKRIVQGEWRPGMILPNEGEIAREYGLSVGTVRKALDWIADAQLISRRQGKGTFVLDWTSHDTMLGRLHFFSAKTEQPIIGTIGSSKLTTSMPNPEEIQHLKLSGEQAVFRIEQVRLLNGAKLSWERHVVPAALFPEIPDKPHEILVFPEFAFTHGVVVGPGRERVSCIPADADLAGKLDVKVGAPLLRIERMLNTIDGVPASWRVGWFMPDDLVYEAELR